MQELEKILEEIGELRGQAGSECTSEDHYIKKAWEHCLDRVVGIIRKHMNDGWISVEDGLPEDREWYLTLFKEPETGFIGLPYIADYLGRKTKTTTNEGWIIRNCTDNDMENCDYYKNLEGVAWRPLPDPYRPERSDNHDRE